MGGGAAAEQAQTEAPNPQNVAYRLLLEVALLEMVTSVAPHLLHMPHVRLPCCVPVCHDAMPQRYYIMIVVL